MELFKDIIIKVDKKYYEDSGTVERILDKYKCDYDSSDSCYTVRGTFERLDKVIDTLVSLKQRPLSATQTQNHQQSPHASAPPVTASVLVVEYILQKCAEKLKKIQGQSFVIEIHPGLKATHRNPHSPVQVTFRAKRRSTPPDRVRLDFVRQQFVTFYQRTASDLEVASLSLGPHDLSDLKIRFPLLCFKPTIINNKATVTGPFAQLYQLKAFLSQKSLSPSDRPGTRVPAGGQRTKPSVKHSNRPEDEPCAICMETIKTEDRKTLRCKHSFCKDCLKTAFKYKPVCPICGELYGVLRGIQPDRGTMKTTKKSSPLPGHEDHGTIVIHYHIPGGIQKEEHPNPGQPYEGVTRTAYLPDSTEGRKILDLLRRAFDQRLTFTIGQSSTSGRSNVVTWNDIHHKTNIHGGPTLYGYPDAEYLSRVREELRVKGIQ